MNPFSHEGKPDISVTWDKNHHRLIEVKPEPSTTVTPLTEPSAKVTLLTKPNTKVTPPTEPSSKVKSSTGLSAMSKSFTPGVYEGFSLLSELAKPETRGRERSNPLFEVGRPPMVDDQGQK